MQLRPNLVAKQLDYFLFIFYPTSVFFTFLLSFVVSFSIQLLDNFPSFHNFLLYG